MTPVPNTLYQFYTLLEWLIQEREKGVALISFSLFIVFVCCSFVLGSVYRISIMCFLGSIILWKLTLMLYLLLCCCYSVVLYIEFIRFFDLYLVFSLGTNKVSYRITKGHI